MFGDDDSQEEIRGLKVLRNLLLFIISVLCITIGVKVW